MVLRPPRSTRTYTLFPYTTLFRASPPTDRGVDPAEARERAGALLARLRIPEALWQLPPATFSGGEQQRVNIAMTFVPDYPILLLDEPTASLDPDNRRPVTDLIAAARGRGAAVARSFPAAEVCAPLRTRPHHPPAP